MCSFASQASAFVATTGARPLCNARAVSPACQFGTGNTPENGYDEKGGKNFLFSPIVGGSKDYPYGEYETDQSGELPAKLLVAVLGVGFPVIFALGIWNSAV